jgi:hypothetical protein
VVHAVVEEMNLGVAQELGFRIEVVTWRTDAFPGFHAEGPQGQIDAGLRIDEAAFVVAIFWVRFGTPVADAESGTQHEIARAVAAWREAGRPHVMVYFKTAAYAPRNQAELHQWAKVHAFREHFPEEGLWGSFKSKSEFEKQLRRDLTNALRVERVAQRRQPRSTVKSRLSRATGVSATAVAEPVFTPRRLAESQRNCLRNSLAKIAKHKGGLQIAVHAVNGSDSDDYAHDFKLVFRSIPFHIGKWGYFEDHEELASNDRYGVWVRWGSGREREYGLPPVGHALVDALRQCGIDVTPLDLKDDSFLELLVYRRRPV